MNAGNPKSRLVTLALIGSYKVSSILHYSYPTVSSQDTDFKNSTKIDIQAKRLEALDLKSECMDTGLVPEYTSHKQQIPMYQRDNWQSTRPSHRKGGLQATFHEIVATRP